MNLAKMAMLRLSAVALFGMLFLTDTVVTAQNLPAKEELAAIEQEKSTNQDRLSRYTWQETQFTFSKRGSGRLQDVLGKYWSQRPISEGFGNRTYRSGSGL